MAIENIRNNLCYTDLVYNRIRKKCDLFLSDKEIETLIFEIVSDKRNTLEKRGKNYYVTDERMKMEVTINSNNYRVITAGKIS